MASAKKSARTNALSPSPLLVLTKADARAQAATPRSTPTLSRSSSTTSASENESVTDVDDTLGDFADRTTHLHGSQTSAQALHSEFGQCANEEYRYTSRHRGGALHDSRSEQQPPYYVLFTTYLSYLLIICLGHIRDFFGKSFRATEYKHLRPWNGYAALNSDFDSFFTRRVKLRIDDCFSHPVTGVPGRSIVLLDRHSPDHNKTMVTTGTRTRALNIASYNYLGFAQSRGACADAVEAALQGYGLAAGGARREGGTMDLHVQTEALVARFLGVEDALVGSMGFATNSTIIPGLVGKGCLVISDQFNHASIRSGVRLSGACVRTFKHNDMGALERLLREVIGQGQPRTHRAWRKILVIVEGLYSMEGTLVNLPAIMELKKKYKFNLFIDEAHSIGAMGPTGRGVTDYFGVDRRDVDILMGTFTKSFGAMGGYVAGTKTIIDRLRLQNPSGTYCESMSPPVLAQIIASMASVMGVTVPVPDVQHLPQSYAHSHALEVPEVAPGAVPASFLPSWMVIDRTMADGSAGRTRLQRLAFNARYLNRGLRKLGFVIYGCDDSPVVPLLLFQLGKMGVFSRLMRTRAVPIVVVVVEYPATPLGTARVRFCVSASHTKEDIDGVLRACDEIGDMLGLKLASGERWPVEEIIGRAVELVRMPEVS